MYVVVWVNIDVSKSGRNRRGVGYKVIRAACLGVWEELNRWEMEGWLIVMCGRCFPVVGGIGTIEGGNGGGE